MLAILPRDIILEIGSYLIREDIYKDMIEDLEEDGVCCDQEKDLLNYTGEGLYYPLHCFYATCKSFIWLEDYEYICIECGELYFDIVTRTIIGKKDGMFYNAGYNTIIGYALHENGMYIHGNTIAVSGKSINVNINEVNYRINDNCNRWNGSCKCTQCMQYEKEIDVMYNKNLLLQNIIKYYNNDIYRGKVFIKLRK